MNNIENHLIFRVKDQLFSVHVDNVNSIIQIPKLFKVPQAPEYIIGVINVEGDVIPIIDAGIKIKMQSIEIGELSQVVILERAHHDKKKVHKLGFLVDDVKDVTEFDNTLIKPLPTTKYHFDERMVDGMHKNDKEFVMQINVENLFKDEIDELFADSKS